MEESTRNSEDYNNSGLSDNLRRIGTSTLMLIPAFVVSNLILQGTIATLANAFHYKVNFTYNHVTLAPYDYHYWSLARVYAIQLMPPVLCLGLAFLIFILLKANPKWISRVRLFTFWLMVCLANIFLGHLVFAPLGVTEESRNFYQTFAIVGRWLFLTPEVMTVFSVLSIIASIICGLAITTELLRFSFSNKLIKTQEGKNVMAFQLYMAPLILAALPLLLLSTEANLLPSIIIVLNLVLFGFGMLLMNASRRVKVKVDKTDVLNSFPALELAVCGLVWVAVYFFLR